MRESKACVTSKTRNLAKFTMVIAWGKQAGAKVYFRHESQMGHEIEPSTSLTNMHPQRLRQKRCGLWLTFFAT